MFRIILSAIKTNQKFYSTNITKQTNNEIVKKINSRSLINIISPFHITLTPYDLIECQDSNKLRARLTTSNKLLNLNINQTLDIKINDHIVDVITKNDIDDGTITCHLEVPISANLNVQSKGNINISGFHNDSITASSDKIIKTNNIQSSDINIHNMNGDIHCNGITLAREFNVSTENKGNIYLGTLKGDFINCTTENGDINVKSCYVEQSKFSTKKGDLFLDNVHKFSEVLIFEEGKIKMTGINGNIYLRSKSGDVDMQFSEIIDENIIIAEDSKNVDINISDNIEHDSFIQITADTIELDSTLSHLSDCFHESKKNNFAMGKEENYAKKLMISARGIVKFGKMSWADCIKKKFN